MKCRLCKSELTREEAIDVCSECNAKGLCMGCMADHDCDDTADTLANIAGIVDEVIDDTIVWDDDDEAGDSTDE